MRITEVKIRKLIPEADIENGVTRVRAIVSIVIDDVFAVHDLKIIQGIERMFVAMPNRKDEEGKFRDIVHPIDDETRSLIETIIMDAYERARKEAVQYAESAHREVG